MRAVAILVALGWLVHAATSFRAHAGDAPDVAGATLAFAALLLAALFAGRLAARISFPKIVGYILVGIVCGPHGLELVSAQMLGSLSLLNGIAICLIALTAGAELNLHKMRPLLGTVGRLSLFAVLGTGGILSASLVVAARAFFPFVIGRDGVSSWAAAAVVALALTAQSPAVVMAMLNEAKADGPLSRVMLATVVIADLLIIAIFGVASTIIKMGTTGQGDPASAALGIAWELGGSILVGGAVGGILALHGKFVRRDASFFVIVVAVVVSEVGRRVHLDPLIVMLSAGVVLENATRQGAAPLVGAIESASLPIFLVFFAIAGATLHIDSLASLAIPALCIAALRAASLWVGSKLATRGASAPIKRWAFAGLLPQAGLALALATLIPRILPRSGQEAATLALAVVTINELVGPLLLKHALSASGEVGARAEMESAGDDAQTMATNAAPPP